MTLEDFKIGCQQWDRNELLESLYNIAKENNKLEKYIQRQYEDTYTLATLPATKEKKKEYEIRYKVYEDILNKLKEK